MSIVIPYNDRRVYFCVMNRKGTTTFQGIGVQDPTATSVEAEFTDDGCGVQFYGSTTSLLTPGHIYSAPDVCFETQFQIVSGTSYRAWVCFSHYTPLTGDTPAYTLGFRRSTYAGDSTWIAYTHSDSGSYIYDTGVTSLKTRFKIIKAGSVAHLFINNKRVQIFTQFLPPVAQYIHASCFNASPYARIRVWPIKGSWTAYTI